MRSKIYHDHLIATYETDPTMFDPQYVVTNYTKKEDELLKMLKEKVHPRYPNVALKKWIGLSQFLSQNYPNEALKEKIFSLRSYQALQEWITKIPGYGQKTGGLLLRLIVESGICNFDDEIGMIPIDCHDREISYRNGIIDKEKLSPHELKELGAIWIQAAYKNHLSACKIDQYLWSIGSKLCAKRDCKNCPLSETCKRKDKK